MNAPAPRNAIAPEKGQFAFHPIDKLIPSDTNPRKTFNEQRLAELAKTIGEHGVLEPILGRPHPDAKRAEKGELEIVAGERRWRAAKLAKRPEVPVIVRPLNDKQALEIQTIENAQREDLHPLEQADGYERLIKEFGYTPEAIADAIGKSRAHVFQIRKLKQLAPKLREHFIAGEMDTTLATVFARVPGAAMQEQAWQRLKQEFREGFSFRAAAEFVRKNYMLDLTRASFSIVDSTLVAKAGACGACPKRTGNQVDLFPDVKNGNVCTDPACFAEKRAAHQVRLVKDYEAQGTRVISGTEAKNILPHDWSRLDNYSSPVRETSSKCVDDEKGRTFGQLAKLAELEPARLQNPHTGDMTPVVEMAKLKKALEAKGIKLRSGAAYSSPQSDRSAERWRAQQRATERRLRLESSIRRKIFEKTIEHSKAKLGRAELAAIAAGYFQDIWHEFRRRVAQAFGWEKLSLHGDGIRKKIAALPEPQIVKLLIALSIVKGSQPNAGSGYKELLAAAQRSGIKPDAIRRDLTAQAKEKLKPKPKAKPKAKAKVKAKAKAPKRSARPLRPTKAARRGVRAHLARQAKPKAPGKVTKRAPAKPAAKPAAKSATATAWPFPTKAKP